MNWNSDEGLLTTNKDDPDMPGATLRQEIKDRQMKDSPVKILIVDDRKENLLSLESIFSDTDYELVRANSGREALRILLKDTDFTLILMDVVMPGMDGFEAATMIYQRDKLKSIPIIFLTAKNLEGNILKAYDVGAVDFLGKPVVPELLKAKVEVFVDLKRKNQMLKMQQQRLKQSNKELQHEIKERKVYEQRIENLNQELAQKLEELEALDAFTSSVSHDLKTPLCGIDLMMQILIKNYAGQMDIKGQSMLEKMDREIKNLTNLINDLLILSRNQKEEMELEEINMQFMVQDVVDELMFKDEGQESKHEVIINRLPKAKCDSKLIKQVWMNLLSNAIKYSSTQEKPVINVRGEQKNGHVTYTVEDNGVGFSKDESKNLFKIFERLSTSQGFDGTGVGLAIVKKIIDRHRGEIWAESEEGKGSKFYFRL